MGDIVCLRENFAIHAGIITDLPPGLGLIHAHVFDKKVVEHSLTGLWSAMIAGVFLFPEVED